MNTRRSRLVEYLILLALFGLGLAACAQPAAGPAQEVIKTAGVIKTIEVQKEGQTVIITATAEALGPAATQAPAAPEVPASTESPAFTEAPAAPAAPAATEAPVIGGDRTQPPPPATLAPADSSAVPQPTTLPSAPGGEQGAEPGKEVQASPAPTQAAQSGALPSATAERDGSPAPATLAPVSPTPAAADEARLVQVEWPQTIRLGESDLIRLTLVPASQGYTLTTEYSDHTTITQTVDVPRPPGYDVFAVARLDGVGFQLAPEGEQAQFLAPDQRIEWRWSLTPRQTGRQRLSMALWLRWVPAAGMSGAQREVNLYNRSLEIRVVSFLGMTQSQALLTGLLSLVFGGGLGAFSLAIRPHAGRSLPRLLTPGANPDLAIELPPRAAAPLHLSPAERRLLQTLFNRYSRLVIEHEFLSGYSGARAFLARPILPDGRADAYTIAKLGERESIRQEFANYEAYVKDTLPPITARIQHPPVAVRAGGSGAPAPNWRTSDAASAGLAAAAGRLAAIQYTFIGQAGQAPLSLRQALLENPDPALLHKLLDTFGPNWWLQHRPYTFRLAQEYDRLLPAHLVITPVESGGRAAAAAVSLDGRTPPGDLALGVGELVSLRHFRVVEQRFGSAPGEERLSLAGQPPAGHPPLRLRWLSSHAAEGALGRVSATRHTLLTGMAGPACQHAQSLGLPDPLAALPALLGETVTGSQSTIHGDLNLENILLGPGGLAAATLWLIDFAQTRDGHTLLDFAHLSAELIAHILAPQIEDPQAYLALLRDPGASPHAALQALLEAVQEMAGRCLFNPFQPREFDLALTLACLGALKYANLNAHQRGLLYLTAAQRIQHMEGK